MRTKFGVLFALAALLSETSASGWLNPPADSVSYSGATILTPDRRINAQLREGSVAPGTVVDVRVADGGIIVNPLLREGWTWLAARGIQVKGRTLSFVFL